MGKALTLVILLAIGTLGWQWAWPYTVKSKEAKAAELERAKALFAKEEAVRQAADLGPAARGELERMYVASQEKGWFKYEYPLFVKRKPEEAIAQARAYEAQLDANAELSRQNAEAMSQEVARQGELWKKHQDGAITRQEFEDLARSRNQTPVWYGK